MNSGVLVLIGHNGQLWKALESLRHPEMVPTAFHGSSLDGKFNLTFLPRLYFRVSFAAVAVLCVSWDYEQHIACQQDLW